MGARYGRPFKAEPLPGQPLKEVNVPATVVPTEAVARQDFIDFLTLPAYEDYVD